MISPIAPLVSLIFKPSGRSRKTSAPCTPERSYFFDDSTPAPLPDAMVGRFVYRVEVVPALGLHEGEPAAEAGAGGIFGPVVVEDDDVGGVFPELSPTETVCEVVVVLLRGHALAGGEHVVPVLHVVGLGRAGGPVVAHGVMADGVLDDL